MWQEGEHEQCSILQWWESRVYYEFTSWWVKGGTDIYQTAFTQMAQAKGSNWDRLAQQLHSLFPISAIYNQMFQLLKKKKKCCSNIRFLYIISIKCPWNISAERLYIHFRSLPGPVETTIEFFASITQSIQSAKPWQTPGFVNPICSTESNWDCLKKNMYTTVQIYVGWPVQRWNTTICGEKLPIRYQCLIKDGICKWSFGCTPRNQYITC